MRSVRADEFLGTLVLFVYWCTRLLHLTSEDGPRRKALHSVISNQLSDVGFGQHESRDVVHLILDPGIRSGLYLLDDEC